LDLLAAVREVVDQSRAELRAQGVGHGQHRYQGGAIRARSDREGMVACFSRSQFAQIVDPPLYLEASVDDKAAEFVRCDIVTEKKVSNRLVAQRVTVGVGFTVGTTG
jgi:hypothetical protein